MLLLVMITGICAAAVLFLLRFLIALCQDSEPGNAVHLLRVTPAHTGGDAPHAGETTEHSNEADHRAFRRRRANERPAATRRAAPMESHPVVKGHSVRFP